MSAAHFKQPCALCGRKIRLDDEGAVYSTHTRRRYCGPRQEKRCNSLYKKRQKEGAA